MSSVTFHSELSSFKLKDKTKIKSWLKGVAERHKGSIRAIQYIFCDDAYLLEVNKQYLNHSTLTDIITFRYNEFPQPLESDIFISIERVRENALSYNVTFERELLRVMVHGVLHLLGFKDKTSEEKEVMRKEEDECLFLFEEAK